MTSVGVDLHKHSFTVCVWNPGGGWPWLAGLRANHGTNRVTPHKRAGGCG